MSASETRVAELELCPNCMETEYECRCPHGIRETVTIHIDNIPGARAKRDIMKWKLAESRRQDQRDWLLSNGPINVADYSAMMKSVYL